MFATDLSLTFIMLYPVYTAYILLNCINPIGMDEKEVCLQNLSYLAYFSVDLSFFQHVKVIKFSSLKQQIYGSVILSRSRTSAILAQFFLIHVV